MGTSRGLHWLVVALIAAVVAGVVVVGAVVIDRWWLWLFLGIATPVFVGVLLRNPAHRFARAGSMCLGSGIAMAATPIVSIQAVGRVAIEKFGSTATTEFALDKSPWLAGLLIVGGCFFYWMDHKRDQPANTPSGSHGPKQIVTGLNATATQATQNQPSQSPMVSNPSAPVTINYNSVPSSPPSPPPLTLPTDNLDLTGVSDNPNFVGRDEDLNRLDDALTKANVASILVLTGEGGVGKTELGRVYAARNRCKFAGAWWLDASSLGLDAAIAEALRHRTGKDVPVGATPDQIRALFLQSLPEGTNLIILDNAESPDLFAQFKLNSPSRVLATAQRDFGHLAGVTTFDVQTISEEAGIDLLLMAWKDRPNPPSRDSLRPIVRDDLACHTYALDLARSYLARFSATTPAQYRQMLEVRGGGQVDEEEATEAEDKTGRRYRKSVRRALLPHLEELKATEEGRQALTMLELASFCHPSEIPFALLAEAMGIDLAKSNALAERLGHGAMLRISRTTGHAWMHRLAQSILRRGLTEERFVERVLALTKYFALLYGHPYDVPTMDKMRAGLVHLHHSAEVLGTSPHPKALRQAYGLVGTTCSAAASFACRISAMQDAERLGIGAVFLTSAAGPKYNSKCVIALTNLSGIAKAQGNLSRASWLIDQANEMVRARMPGDKYASAVVLDARAQVDYTAKRFRHAAAGHARAISLLSSLDTSQVEIKLAVWNNYAATQIELKRYDRALKWINRIALTAIAHSAQPDVHIARTHRHYATIEARRDNLVSALHYARQSLAAEVRRGGDNSQGAAHCYNLIGGLLVRLGRGQEAVPDFIRSLAIMARSSSPLSEGVVGNCCAIAQVSRDWETIVRNSLHDLPPDVKENVIQATKNRLPRR